MPPKKKEQKGPSAKTLQKEKNKVIEDKTFGLKNKNKSKAVQNYVKQVSNQVNYGGQKGVSVRHSKHSQIVSFFSSTLTLLLLGERASKN